MLNQKIVSFLRQISFKLYYDERQKFAEKILSGSAVVLGGMYSLVGLALAPISLGFSTGLIYFGVVSSGLGAVGGVFSVAAGVANKATLTDKGGDQIRESCLVQTIANLVELVELLSVNTPKPTSELSQKNNFDFSNSEWTTLAIRASVLSVLQTGSDMSLLVFTGLTGVNGGRLIAQASKSEIGYKLAIEAEEFDVSLKEIQTLIDKSLQQLKEHEVIFSSQGRLTANEFPHE